MENNLSFVPLLLVVFLAFIVPFALTQFKKVRLPVVVGEIIAGIIIGRSGFGLVEGHDPMLDLLSELGFVFLMFLSGMEIDFRGLSLSSRGKAGSNGRWGAIQLGGVSFMLTLVLSVGISFGIVRLNLARDPMMMALILSTTSLGVVLPVLKEQGITSSRYGQALLVAALIADFATMLLITIEVAALSHGLTLDVLLVSLLFVAFFLMYHFGRVFFNRITGVRRILDELSHAATQIKVRAAFTIMLIFVVLSEVLGAEVILGAFLAGAIIALLRTSGDGDLSQKLEGIGFGFFIPIFFIKVGVDFNFEALLGSSQAIALVPALLLAAIMVKLLPTLVFRLGFSWRETFGAGALLSARLSLIIAASAIGLRLGVIGEAVNAAIILVAVLTVTIAPWVFVRLAPAAQDESRRFIVIAGAGDLGLRVAGELNSHQERLVVIDDHPRQIQRAQEMGFLAVESDLTRPNGTAARYLDGAKALICTQEDAETSYRICQTAHGDYGVSHIVAQVNDPVGRPRFDRLGVKTMHAGIDRATLLALMGRNPAVYSLLTRVDDDKDVIEIVVRGDDCDRKRLRDLQFPGDVLVLALRRNGEMIIPHGNTALACGDHLTLVGSLQDLEAARSLF